MSKTKWALMLVVGTLGLLIVLMIPGQDSGRSFSIDNWPSAYNVQGAVKVNGFIKHAEMEKREGVIVTTSRRTELAELIPAGVLDCDGFTSVALSLQGEVKSESPDVGTVGVLLVPDEEPVLRALKDGRRVEFALETSTQVLKGASPYFDGGSVTLPLAFPRYRIYLYNTMTRGVEANVYMYMTN